MSECLFRAISAGCSIATAIVTALGAIVVYFQIRRYVEARKIENRKKEEELIAKLYFTDIDLNRLLIQEPLVQRAMHDDRRGDFFQNLPEIDKSKCNAVSQMYGDLLEYYTMLEKNLEATDEDSKQMASCWENYVTYLWTNSFAFRRHIVLTKDTWTLRFRRKFPKEEFERLENDLKSR